VAETFTLAEFERQRPFLYHVIARQNVEHLRATHVLYSAASLAAQAGQPRAVMERRRAGMSLITPSGRVILRDQAALHFGSAQLEGGWTEASLLRALAEHVFLWPGTEHGPVRCGRSHFAKYVSSDAVLRLPFAAVVGQMPRFCRFNSGSPRCSGGHRSPRGPRTFVDAEACSFGASSVVEVVFRDQLKLPSATALGPGLDGPWSTFTA
jgi:hypothetical protein